MYQSIGLLLFALVVWIYYYNLERKFLAYDPEKNSGYFFKTATWPQPYHTPRKCPHCQNTEDFEYGHICTPRISYRKLLQKGKSGEHIQIPYANPIRRFRAFHCKQCNYWIVKDQTLGADVLTQ